MASIRKFSLAYVAPEDRIAWDVEDEGGRATRLWLTQRFCRKFVEVVIQRLPTPAGADAPAHAQTAQSFAQAAAMSQLGKTPGVSVGPQTPGGLVRTVHIRTGPGGLTLVFEFGQGESREIPLSAAAARQMLGVLHRLYLAANWPTDVWPAWVAAQPAQTDARALN